MYPVPPCVLSARSAVPFVTSIASIEPPLPSAHAAGAIAIHISPATATAARFIVPPSPTVARPPWSGTREGYGSGVGECQFDKAKRCTGGPLAYCRSDR